MAEKLTPLAKYHKWLTQKGRPSWDGTTDRPLGYYPRQDAICYTDTRKEAVRV